MLEVLFLDLEGRDSLRLVDHRSIDNLGASVPPLRLPGISRLGFPLRKTV